MILALAVLFLALGGSLCQCEWHGFHSLGSLSGACGDDVTWTLDPATGAVSIQGTGPMWNYGDDFRSPFYDNPDIKSVVIGSGVTSIGDDMFAVLRQTTKGGQWP